jgi:transmembrane sensor
MSTVDPGKDIREQAARWVIRMTESPDSLSAAERDEFDAWISDPRQAQEFHAVHNVTAITADLAESDRARLSEWARNYTNERTHSRRQVVRWWSIAASLLVVLMLGGYYAQTKQWFGESGYVTHAGETHVVTFPDESVAYLNTRTEVRWIGSGRDRRVELIEGEALFEVVHDPDRPFRVVLDNSEIRVLGTRFNVYRKPTGEITVTTLEGTVVVRGFGKGDAQPAWERTIHANEQVKYRSIGLVDELHKTQAQDAVLWRDGTYKFENEPIADVLEELARYTDQHIVIRDPAIAQIPTSGVFSVRDVRRALRRLKDLAPVEVHERNGTFTVESRAEATQGKD